MADFIKLEKSTPHKPEIRILARKLGVSIGDAFLSFVKLYCWADDTTADGSVPFLSLSDGDNCPGCVPGTCAALADKEIGWIEPIPHEKGGGFRFTKWEKHNGKCAKARALERLKKENQRDLSRKCPDDNGTKTGLEGEGEGEGEFPLSETRRGETSFCDFFLLEQQVERFRRFGLLEKPQDRSLVAKICTLTLLGQFPRDWLEQWIESLGKKKRGNSGAYLTACARTKCDEFKMSLKTLLATVKIPTKPEAIP